MSRNIEKDITVASRGFLRRMQKADPPVEKDESAFRFVPSITPIRVLE